MTQVVEEAHFAWNTYSSVHQYTYSIHVYTCSMNAGAPLKMFEYFPSVRRLLQIFSIGQLNTCYIMWVQGHEFACFDAVQA